MRRTSATRSGWLTPPSRCAWARFPAPWELTPICPRRLSREFASAWAWNPRPVSSQVIQRDRHAFYLSTLAVAAASLEKIALEVRGLQRTEVREVEEYFSPEQKGSSAMPHKRNPITAEQICGLARVVRSNAQAALENVALWHERDISHSSVERVILADSTILLDYLLAKTANLVENDVRLSPSACGRIWTC